MDSYDYLIVNDDLDQAVESLRAVFVAERLKRRGFGMATKQMYLLVPESGVVEKRAVRAGADRDAAPPARLRMIWFGASMPERGSARQGYWVSCQGTEGAKGGGARIQGTD